MGRRAVLLLALFFLVLPILSAGRAPAAQEGTLEIATKSGVRVFAIELAVTDEERAKGLMFRKELPEGRGMLFDFKREQPVSMWMQNTYVSLDMIFIRDDGRIARIAENTEVLSERIIPSGAPVRAVLEVVAGTAKKLGIATGDRVASPLLNAR
jgi:uncharacterized membrane protein (UPF0127 family)